MMADKYWKWVALRTDGEKERAHTSRGIPTWTARLPRPGMGEVEGRFDWRTELTLLLGWVQIVRYAVVYDSQCGSEYDARYCA